MDTIKDMFIGSRTNFGAMKLLLSLQNLKRTMRNSPVEKDKVLPDWIHSYLNQSG